MFQVYLPKLGSTRLETFSARLSSKSSLQLLPSLTVVGPEEQAAQGAGDVSGSSKKQQQRRSSHRAMSQVYLQPSILYSRLFDFWRLLDLLDMKYKPRKERAKLAAVVETATATHRTGRCLKSICKKIDWPFSPFGHRHMIMDGPFWE